MAVPNTFATDTGSIPLADLDANFSYYDTAYSIASTTVTFNGNIGFAGTGKRITGDFSNATATNRVSFETSTTDGGTFLGAFPNGTALQSGIVFNNANSSTANRSTLAILANTTLDVSFRSNIVGSGTYLPMTFYTGGSERVRIDTSGNVGIGTTSPAYKLDVAGAISTNNNLTFTGTGNRITGDFSSSPSTLRVAFQTSSANSNTVMPVIPSGTATQAGFDFYNNSDITNAAYARVRSTSTEASVLSSITGTGTYIPLNFYTGGSERVRIDTSGNVGIGTSSPAANSLTIASKNAVMTSGFGMSWNSNATQLAGYDTNILQFITASAERMRITSAGILNIGGTSGGSVGELLVVEGANSAGHRAARINNTSTTNGYSTLWMGSSNDGLIRGGSTAGAFTDQLTLLTSGAIPISFYTNNTERMRITSAGNLLLGATSQTWDEKQAIGLGGTSTAVGLGLYSSNSSYTGSMVRVQAETTSTAWKIYEGRGNGGAVLYYVDGTGGGYFAGNTGIGTTSPSASAFLDVQSTTKGVRFPNMTTTQKNAISSPAAGLVVFDTTLSKLAVYSGAAWQTITSV